MFDFQEKRKIKRVVFSKATIFSLAVLTVLIGMSAFERMKVERETAAKLLSRQEELHELQERAAVLEARVERLRDERGIEEEIRSRFDVAREHEQVVVLIEDETQATNGVTSTPFVGLPARGGR